MTRKLISALTAFIILFTTFPVFGDESGTDDDMANFDNNLANQPGEQDADMFFNTDSDDVWVIPDYDKTGMTDFDIMRKNMYYYTVDTLASVKNVDNTIDEALSLYQDNGSWPGLDYWAYEMQVLPYARHFRYTQCMIAGYRMPESKYYKNEELYNKILKSLDFFYNTVTRRYEKGKTMMNWWNYTIGSGLAIQPMLVLGYDILPYEYIEKYCERFLYSPHQMDSGLVTGTNGVWYAMNAFYKGVLTENEDELTEAINIIRNMMKIQDETTHLGGVVASPSNEGMQTDYSFHQHGAKYYANYSNGFLDFIKVSTFLYGTKYEMTDMFDTVINGIVDGWVYVYHRNMLDANQHGRVIASPGAGGILLTEDTDLGDAYWAVALQQLAKLYPKRADECLEYSKYFLSPTNKDAKVLTKSKYFYRSEYLCHHKQNWTLFNQLNSRRSNAAEYNCYDQIWGYWLGFGHTFLYKGDEPYYGSNRGQAIYWDWSLIPGVTSSEYLHEYTMSGYSTFQQGELFAGGISDGDYSMTAMKLSDRAGVSAKKSWFCFDDEYVSLGSGIESTSKYNVRTTVEQRRLAGTVEVDGKEIEKGEREYKNVKSVLHFGIGYVFPEGEDVFIRADKQYGSYATTNRYANYDRTMYSEDMFTMYIPHDNEKKDTYCYITVPETDSEKLAQYCENNKVRIIENSEDIQAVYHDGVNAGGAVFYKNGSVDFKNGLNVTSDSICCLLVREKDGKLYFSVSNPYAKKTTVGIKVNYNGKTYDLSFELPGLDKDNYDYGGKTVTKVLDV